MLISCMSLILLFTPVAGEALHKIISDHFVTLDHIRNLKDETKAFLRFSAYVNC